MSPKMFVDELNTVRNLYLQAVLDSKKIDEFLDFSGKIESLSPTIKAYHGAALIMKISYLENDLDKFNTFLKGREKIENAVGLDNENIEIRFIRYMIQINIPKFLIYNNFGEDKKAILKDISQINQIDNIGFRQAVFDGLLESVQFSAIEKSIIRIYEKNLRP